MSLHNIFNSDGYVSVRAFYNVRELGEIRIHFKFFTYISLERSFLGLVSVDTTHGQYQGW